MPANNNRNNNGRRSVLITRFSALGDVAMALPVVYGVCHANPGVDFVFVTARPLKALFINHPANLTVVEADIHGKDSGPAGIARLTRRLIEQYRVTDIADIHNVIRTGLMRLTARLHGVRTASIDKGRADKRRLIKGAPAHRCQLPTSASRYADVFSRLGLATDSSFTSLWPGDKADPAVFAGITPPKPLGAKWVGIAPFAAHKGKVYPPERMEKVVEILASDPDVTVFLFGGGSSEREVLGSWASRSTRVISLAEKRHGFAVELALMSHLDCLVAMDSGNAHLGALAGIPVISIWGATHPYAGFTAWRQQPDDMLQQPLPCRPCSVFGNTPCRFGDYRCFNGISPEAIASRVKHHLYPNTSLNGR